MKIVLFSLFPLLGCPYGHTSRTADNILTDMCSDKDDKDWTVKEDAANSTEASVTINLGCMKKVKEIRLKNIKKEKGGTKTFTIYLSDSIEGPWRQILTDEFSEKTTNGCAASQTVDLEYV